MAGACFCLRLFRHQFLWLLGANYWYLDKELAFYSGVSCAGTVTSMSMMLLYARGWADYMWISPVTEVLCQLAAIRFLDLSTPMGVLRLDSVRIGVAAIVYGSLVAIHFVRTRRKRDFRGGSGPGEDLEQKSDLETLHS